MKSFPRPLFDVHCHLQDNRIGGRVSELLSRAVAVGIKKIVCAATSEEDWGHVSSLTREYPAMVLPGFGIHPCYLAGRTSHWLHALHSMLELHPSAGISEIGIDHALNDRSDAEQLDVFSAQWLLAAEMRRTVTLHCRRAWGALLDFLRAESARPPAFIIHSYSGGPDIVPELVKHGAFFSFSTSVTHPNNKRAHAAAAVVPADRLLIETDAPDMTPALETLTHRGFALLIPGANEPACLPMVLDALSRIRGIPHGELAECLLNNTATALGTEVLYA